MKTLTGLVVDVKTSDSVHVRSLPRFGESNYLEKLTKDGIENLFSEEITITDFAIQEEDLFFIANSFTQEVMKSLNTTEAGIEKISKSK